MLSALEILTTVRYINQRFTYLLAYLYTRVFTCATVATSTQGSVNKVSNEKSSGKSNNGLSGKSLSDTYIIAIKNIASALISESSERKLSFLPRDCM